MKLDSGLDYLEHIISFSILKRIVMGETRQSVDGTAPDKFPFSILKRIVMGET